MTISKYIITSIINTISIILPISNNAHINIIKNTFETNIFNHPTSFFLTINIGITIPIIYILIKEIKIDKNILKKQNIKKLKLIPYFSITTIIPIIIFIISNKLLPVFNTKFFITKITPIIIILNAIIILIINKNSNKEKNIKLSHLIFINIINSLSIIPGLSNISLTLFTTYILKFSKKQSLLITLLTTLFYTLYLFIIQINNFTYPLHIYIICIITTIITSKIFLNYLIRLYNKNKLSKISIYLIIISLLTLYWFR